MEHQEKFAALRAEFPDGNCRAIIKISLTRISDYCGYGVPRLEYLGERKSHENMLRQITPEELDKYRQMNESCVDGLPGLLADKG